MSVYTTLNNPDLHQFLAEYRLGELAGFEGISDGIENTNYFVTTRQNNKQHQWVLTVFESLSDAELPYFLELMAYLAEQGLPSAHPVADKQGSYLQTLKQKPAALVERLLGKSILKPDAGHCQQIGLFLAKLHKIGKGFDRSRRNTRDKQWLFDTAKRLMPKLEADDRQLLEQEIRFLQGYPEVQLPDGLIHADLFRDNALFSQSKLTGVIDFYYACDDFYLYDLAITVNDWCSGQNGVLDEQNTKALLEAYNKHRPLHSDEQEHWPMLLRRAALRFWLSRLYDQYFPRPGELTHIKDPLVFKSILLQRIKQYASPILF